MLIYLGSVATTYLVVEGDQAWRVRSCPFLIYLLTKEWLFITIGHQEHLQWRSSLEAIRFTWIATHQRKVNEIKSKEEKEISI